MSFNFEQAFKESKEQNKDLLFAIVLGASGAGKSTLMGTLPGKTLYLYASGESHGPKSAQSLSKEIFPVCIDQAGGDQLSPDQAYGRILEVLSDTAGIQKQGFKAIAVDSATEIEAMIRGTGKWKEMCSTASGKHNGFAEPGATVELFRPILVALKRLQKTLDLHVAMTCALEVKDLGPSGEILDSAPRLIGYSVAESVVQQFDDVLVVGRMTKGTDVKHKLQMLSDVTKVSKDAAGSIKKTFNFAPRVAGLTVSQLPQIMDADLAKVAQLKKGK